MIGMWDVVLWGTRPRRLVCPRSSNRRGEGHGSSVALLGEEGKSGVKRVKVKRCVTGLTLHAFNSGAPPPVDIAVNSPSHWAVNRLSNCEASIAHSNEHSNGNNNHHPSADGWCRQSGHSRKAAGDVRECKWTAGERSSRSLILVPCAVVLHTHGAMASQPSRTVLCWRW